MIKDIVLAYSSLLSIPATYRRWENYNRIDIRNGTKLAFDNQMIVSNPEKKCFDTHSITDGMAVYIITDTPYMFKNKMDISMDENYINTIKIMDRGDYYIYCLVHSQDTFHCNKCGSKVNKHNKYCSECGSKLKFKRFDMFKEADNNESN